MSLINPVKSTGSMSGFIAKFDAAFGEHIGTVGTSDVHYLDDKHSLGFYSSSRVNEIYIGNVQIYSGNKAADSYPIYYIFSQNRNALYFYTASTSGGVSYRPTVIAAKASNGKWNVLFKDNTKEEAAKLYFNAPQSNFIVHEPALVASAANAPYIISPYPDINGGIMSELFRVDYLSGFDPQNPPVLVVGDDLYAVPPYPLTASDTAAFAVPIDPADYE